MNFKNVDFNKIFRSKTFKIVLWCLVGFIILLFVLKLGMVVGFKKANFSYRWGENYHQNFAGPRSGFFGGLIKDFSGRDFIGAHGVFGQIIKIESSTLIIKGQDNTEKIVLVKDNTVIERLRDTIKSSDLKVDDYIVIIGEPNDKGQIEAKFIRLLPSPLPMQPSLNILPRR